MNGTDGTADAGVNAAFEALSAGDMATAAGLLAQGLREHPQDSRFHVMAAALAEAQGAAPEAFAHLWRALAAEPASALARAELVRLAVTPGTAPQALRNLRALDDGRRQSATSVDAIRVDHRARYAMAARWIRLHLPVPRLRVGLDVFCGNGYGCRMLADLAGVRMLGLDGSASAVTEAEATFGSHRVVFGQALFPFALPQPLFDFALAFAALELVDDPAQLLAQMASATHGPLIVSVPHEPGLPLARLGRRFDHHLRHFRRDEIVALLAAVGRTRIAAEYGQQAYAIEGDDTVVPLPDAQMGLTPFDPRRSQFLVLVADAA